MSAPVRRSVALCLLAASGLAGCLVTPNETCDAAGGPIHCNAGLTCNPQSGLCEPQGTTAGSGSSTGIATGSSTTSSSTGSTSGSTGSSFGTSSGSGTGSSSGSTGVTHVAEVVPVGGPSGSANFALYDLAVASNGTIYASDLRENAVVTFSGGTPTTVAGGNGVAEHGDGSGTSALLAAPWGMVFVGSTLYFMDSGDGSAFSYLRTLDAQGNVSTICGNGVDDAAADGACSLAQFDGPAGIAYDPAGFIYVADYGESRVQRVDLGQMQVETWAGSSTAGFKNGQGIAAEFANPAAVAVDGQGNVFVADFGNMAIRKIDPARNVSTFAQMPSASPVPHGRPFGVAVDAQGNVYASDIDNSQLVRWSADGTLTAQISDPNLDGPVGLKLDPAGGLFVATTSGKVLHVAIP